MADRFRLTLAQLNPTVGALGANADLAYGAWQAAKEAGAGMVALPEMFVTGYQTQDLIRRPAFAADVHAVLEGLAARCADGPAMGIGGPLMREGRLFNAWFVLEGGRIAATVLKHHLPNDAVFDEVRLFASAEVSGPVRVGPIRIGVPICEDAWHPDVAETLEETGAEVLLVPNGSPYHRDKLSLRQGLMVARVVETGLPLVYLNMVGGQDDQVFDGASFALNPGGRLAVQMEAFEAGLVHVDLVRGDGGWRVEEGEKALQPDAWEADYHAMVLGLRDYLAKTGFREGAAGPVGRRGQRHRRGHRVRRHRPRQRALRHAALALHLAGLAR